LGILDVQAATGDHQEVLGRRETRRTFPWSQTRGLIWLQISEKPIAGTYAEALRLLKHYDDLPASKPLWAVAEQFRFMKFQDVLVNRIAGLGKLSFFTMEL
jgi:hypothetical protein